MSDPVVAFFTSTRPWSQRWQLYVRDHGGVVIADVVAERLALFDYHWQVLVLDATADLMDPAIIHLVQDRGRGLLAVWDPSDDDGKRSALEAGVEMIESGAPPDEFVDRVTALSLQFPTPTPSAARGTRRPRPSVAAGPPRRAGQMVAVGGPIGANPETVAMGLAKEVSGRGEPTVLVDANELCPSLAQLLGLNPVPNLASAVTATRSGPGDHVDHLQVASSFYVLPGLAEPGQWAEITPHHVWSLVTTMSARFARTIVAVGPVAEDLGHHGDRFGTTRAMLAEADAIVAVGVGDPVGLARLTVWVADARVAAPVTPLYLAIGAAPGDSFRRAQIESAITDLGHAAGMAMLSAPSSRVGRAAWQGRIPKGRLMRDVADLAKLVCPKQRGRKR